jgi:hypothetical protein
MNSTELSEGLERIRKGLVEVDDPRAIVACDLLAALAREVRSGGVSDSPWAGLARSAGRTVNVLDAGYRPPPAAPLMPMRPGEFAGSYRMKIGHHRGKTIAEIDALGDVGYLRWFAGNPDMPEAPRKMIRSYLKLEHGSISVPVPDTPEFGPPFGPGHSHERPIDLAYCLEPLSWMRRR